MSGAECSRRWRARLSEFGKPCTIPDCDRKAIAIGLCKRHYWRIRTNGRPDVTVDLVSAPEVRFWAQVDKNGPIPSYAPQLGKCWIWLASDQGTGYGTIGVNGQPVLAHVFSYRLHGGTIPEKHEVDHLCYIRRCVNWDHLEAVTKLENLRREREKVRFYGRFSAMGLRAISLTNA